MFFVLSDVQTALAGWRTASERDRLLQVVQPGLIGLIDGTISTLAPIFASAFVGGSLHALPFLISDLGKALTVAYVVVSCELVLIALVRKRYLKVSLASSL